MEPLIEFVNRIQDFFNGGFFDWFDAILTQITYYYTLWIIESKIYFATIAWEVAQTLLANFQISSLLQNSWNAIPSEAMAYLNYFRLPEAINILLQGATTSFVIRMVT